MSRIQRVVCGFVGACALACASSGTAGGGGEEGKRILVALQNFKSGERFELASESHTDRVTYYSDERHDARRKVQTDEIMSAFVGELSRQGYTDHAQAGRAPAIGSGDVIRWGLEVQQGKDETHWLVGTGSPAPDWQTFQKCRDIFLQLYNITVSFQTVENPSGKDYFGTPAAGQKKR